MRLQGLKLIVNDPRLYTAFMDYLDDEIALAHRGLGQAKDLRDLGRIQGQVDLLQKMKRLRETVNGAEA